MATIMIDYDNTWTADHELWGQFANNAIARGHTVFICTYRCDWHPVGQVPVPVYYSGGMAKKAFLETLGIKADIYIDDNPYAIGFDEDYKPS